MSNNSLKENKTVSTDNFEIISGYTSDLNQSNFNTLGKSSMLARTSVPESHKKTANSFMLIKKLFGFSAIQAPINFEDRKTLADFNFDVLERSSLKQMNEELTFLKRWSKSNDQRLRDASDKIIEIRAKELKYLISSSYRDITDERHNAYKGLERYFEVIAHY